jgi:hypothetical protein
MGAVATKTSNVYLCKCWNTGGPLWPLFVLMYIVSVGVDLAEILLILLCNMRAESADCAYAAQNDK